MTREKLKQEIEKFKDLTKEFSLAWREAIEELKKENHNGSNYNETLNLFGTFQK